MLTAKLNKLITANEWHIVNDEKFVKGDEQITKTKHDKWCRCFVHGMRKDTYAGHHYFDTVEEAIK